MAKFKVKAGSNFPESSASWVVDTGDDPVVSAVYINLAYNLLAQAMGKLGVAMSEHVLGEDAKLTALGEECGCCVDPHCGK